MRYRLFTIMSTASLVLCVAAALFWVRSYWRYDRLNFDTARKQGIFWSFTSSYGNIEVVWGIDPRPVASASSLWGIFGGDYWPNYEFESDAMTSHRLGSFVIGKGTLDHSDPAIPYSGKGARPKLTIETHVIGFPHWLLVVVFSLVPLRHASSIIRKHRRGKQGLCSRCGYDLRASKDRCPECGTPIPTKAEAKP